jgi:hypothetical protein
MAERACEDIFCKGCDAEVKRRNQQLETEVRDLTARLARKADLQYKLDQAQHDLFELKKNKEHQDELLYLYRTAHTARKALEWADAVLDQGRGHKRARGEM